MRGRKLISRLPKIQILFIEKKAEGAELWGRNAEVTWLLIKSAANQPHVLLASQEEMRMELGGMGWWFCSHNTALVQHRFAPALRWSINIYLNEIIQEESLSASPEVEQSLPTPAPGGSCIAEGAPWVTSEFNMPWVPPPRFSWGLCSVCASAAAKPWPGWREPKPDFGIYRVSMARFAKLNRCVKMQIALGLHQCSSDPSYELN